MEEEMQANAWDGTHMENEVTEWRQGKENKERVGRNVSKR